MATITNQATLSYQNTVTNSNVTTGELLEVVSASKAAVSAGYTADGHVAYALSVVNAGTTELGPVTVSDDLGAAGGAAERAPLSYVEGSARYYVNGAAQTAPAVSAENGLTFSGLTVPAGGSAMLIYDTAVTAFAPPAQGGAIVNTATISGGGLTAPVTAAATVTAAAEPELTIAKSMSPATVTENAALTYTFIIQNSGAAAAKADADIVVSDTFDPALSNITVMLDGETLTAADYSYDEATGALATATGAITVPAATFEQDETDGFWVTTPGVAVLTVSGTV